MCVSVSLLQWAVRASMPGKDASWQECLGPLQHGDAVSSGPFEDEETKALYESLPDIRALVPALLLGLASEQPEAADAEPNRAQDGDPKAHDTEGVPSSAAQMEEDGMSLVPDCFLANLSTLNSNEVDITLAAMLSLHWTLL